MEPRSLSSVEFYDSLAEIYDAELESRARWVGKVEQLIAGWARDRNARSILDIGAGNGRRVWRLMQATGMGGVAIDVSPGMIEWARRLGVEGHVVDMASKDFESGPLQGRKFDMVICTWNVLGHVEGHAARVQAVRNMRAALAPGGAVVLDVNNRYNVNQYGRRAVLRNVLKDTFRPGTAGDFLAHRSNPKGQTMHTLVHVFSAREIEELCREAGLRVVRKEFLDYTTGEPRTQWSGQMCFLIEAAT
jgi:SAM-dependent methyltransferase